MIFGFLKSSTLKVVEKRYVSKYRKFMLILTFCNLNVSPIPTRVLRTAITNKLSFVYEYEDLMNVQILQITKNTEIII